MHKKAQGMTIRTAALATCGLLASTIGCGSVKKTNVSEISAADSGVEISEVASSIDLSNDWPAWRGIKNDGLATARSAPTEWSSDEGVKWMSDIKGRGHSSPTVVGDLVVLATAIEDLQQQAVVAYDRETGDLKWTSVVNEGSFPQKRDIHRKGTNANGTLASNGELLYGSFFNDDKVSAFALDMDGDLIWQKELGAFSSKFGYAPSPVLYKSFVIFAVDNQGGGYIAALDGTSGEIAWRIKRPAINSHSSPIVANVGGKDQLLISGCGTVSSFDPATGDENWSTKATSQTTCGTMVVSKDRVYASGGFPDKEVVCLDANGKRLWQKERIKVYEPSLIAVEDNIYAVGDEGIAYCWSGEDGTENWKKRLGGNFSASPTFCNGNLYVSDLSGKTHVFKANPDQFESVATNKLGADCYSSASIVEGAIFLRIGFQLDGKRQERLVRVGS